MRISSSVKYAIGVTATVAILAGCSSGGSQLAPAVNGSAPGMSSSAVHVKPVWTKYASLIPNNFLRVRGSIPASPDIHIDKKHKKHPAVYVGQFYGSSILGYPKTNPSNNPPLCTISGVSYANDIAADSKKNVIDPDGGTRSVIVFKPNCGAAAGSFSDPYGQPSDAASANAITGTIAVGNILDTSEAYGSVSVCTLSGGCTANLVNTANMDNYVAGVAMANNGDCYASSYNSSGAASITYFKGCAGNGVASTGVLNTTYGGLDIDAKGNLVSIDFEGGSTGQVYIYSGCNPACGHVAGPLALHGYSIFGKLNKAGNTFQAVEFSTGQVDVYKYTGTALTYQYSYNNGLSASEEPEGIAYAPRSKQ